MNLKNLLFLNAIFKYRDYRDGKASKALLGKTDKLGCILETHLKMDSENWLRKVVFCFPHVH